MFFMTDLDQAIRTPMAFPLTLRNLGVRQCILVLGGQVLPQMLCSLHIVMFM